MSTISKTFCVLFTAATALLVLLQSDTLLAQPGVDEPLIVQNFDGWRYGGNVPAGPAAVDNYYLEIEKVDRNSPVFIYMYSFDASANGAIVYPNRHLNFSKTELHYNAIDWRGATPNRTYNVEAFILWNAGVGAISGNYYPSGFKFLSIPVTLQ